MHKANRNKTSPARLAWQLLLFLLLAPLIGNTLTGNFNKDRLLSESGLHSEAVITKLTREDHDTFHYSFKVAEKQYEGIGAIVEIGTRNVEVGKKVNITYIPGDPSVSGLGTIEHDYFSKEITRLVVYSLVLILFIGLALSADLKYMRETSRIRDMKEA